MPAGSPQTRSRFHLASRSLPASDKILSAVWRCLLVLALTFPFAVTCWAAAGGSISGTVRDPTGAVIPVATLILTNTALKSEYQATSEAKGSYSFPGLSVGHYDLVIQVPGFRAQKKSISSSTWMQPSEQM